MKITELHEQNRPPNPSGAPPLDAATQQQHDTATRGLLSGFMAARGQTYEQFMAAFMELKPEDVENFANRKQGPPTPEPSTSAPPPPPTTIPKPTQAISATSTSKAQQHDDGSDLEEEVIDAGEVITSRLMRSESPGRLKMDNFVDDEQAFSSDEEGEHSASTGGYQASFHPGPQPCQPAKEAPKPQFAEQDTKYPMEEASKQPVKETPKSPAEQAPKPEPAKQVPTSPAKEPPKSEPVIKVPKAHTSTDASAALHATPNTAPKPSNAARNTKKKNASKTVDEDLRDEFPDSEVVTESIATIDPQVIRNVSLVDSGDVEEEVFMYDPSQDLPNPGEVEDEMHVTPVTNATHLKFAVLTETTDRENIQPQSPVSESSDVTASDAVQPFSLDEDFDYDNVLLTPKYSAEEMVLLRSAMART